MDAERGEILRSEEDAGACGWSLVRVKSSHFTFEKPGQRPFPVPVHHGLVKYVYVQQIKKMCPQE
jgi:predicted RNA binding protein YcfA (HicA-like mRNA interferase family)